VTSPGPGATARRANPLRVTLVNQYYPPEMPPTAQLTASLAVHLAAQGHCVTVITGGEGYVDTPGDPAGLGGTGDSDVEIVRLWTSALGKGSITRRLADYVTFLVGATVRLVLLPRQDVVISLTTPPFAVVGAVAHKLLRRRTRVVLWSMDCYPDVIERLGSRAALRRGSVISTVLRVVNRWAFRRLDHVVALDEPMRGLLVNGYASDDGTRPPVSVIANWEALAGFPDPFDEPAPTPWAGYADAELTDRFVVLYLGNLGYGHRIETTVAAARELDDTDDVAWLFVGGGARWGQLGEHVAASGSESRIVQRPYVGKDETGAVMAGAGCALILLADEALGVMSPSKLHANLAAGLPIVYVGPAGSNVDAAIGRFGCGVSLRTGDVTGLAATVRRLRHDGAWHHQLSAAARRAFEEAYCDRATLPQWDAILDQSGPGPTGAAQMRSTQR